MEKQPRDFDRRNVKHELNNMFNFERLVISDSLIKKLDETDSEELQYIASELVYVLGDIVLMDTKFFLNKIEYNAVGNTRGDLRNYSKMANDINLERENDCKKIQKKIDSKIMYFDFRDGKESWRGYKDRDVIVRFFEEEINVLYDDLQELAPIVKALIILCQKLLNANDRADLFDLVSFAKYGMKKDFEVRLPAKNIKTEVKKI